LSDHNTSKSLNAQSTRIQALWVLVWHIARHPHGPAASPAAGRGGVPTNNHATVTSRPAKGRLMLAIFEPAFSVSIWVRNLPSAIDPGGAQRSCSVVFNLRTELNYAGGARDAALTPAKFVWGVLNVRDPVRR